MVVAAVASAFHHLPSDFWYNRFGKATVSPTVAESKMPCVPAELSPAGSLRVSPAVVSVLYHVKSVVPTTMGSFVVS